MRTARSTVIVLLALIGPLSPFLVSCGSWSSGSSQLPTRQVTDKIACSDAEAYVPVALSIVFSGKDVWDIARQKGQALLAEDASDPDVNAALQDLGNAGIALADATEEVAADPATQAALAAKDPSALKALSKELEALNVAGDRVSDTC